MLAHGFVRAGLACFEKFFCVFCFVFCSIVTGDDGVFSLALVPVD